MRAVVRLEFIGEIYHSAKREARKRNVELPAQAARYKSMLGHDTSRPWVDRLIGYDPETDFRRVRERGQIDYSEANSVGSRGVYLYYPLDDGIYEVNERVSWTKVRRYFLLVEQGQKREIPQEEAETCLKITQQSCTSDHLV